MSKEDGGVLETTDYDIFKTMKGNREIDPGHVRKLIKSFTDRGNKTKEFPITVNERLEVIDGQHRIAALKELGWPVGYVIRPNLTIGDVRDINYGAQNWTWRDYANSFADLGNTNYARILELADTYKVGYHTLTRYIGFDSNTQRSQANLNFKNGEFILTPEKTEQGRQLLKQLRDLIEVAEKYDQTFPQAVYVIMQNPDYDHARMVGKLEKFGGDLKAYHSVKDYLRALEDIYNYRVSVESDQVRLF